MKKFLTSLLILIAFTAQAQWFYGSGEATNLENKLGFNGSPAEISTATAGGLVLDSGASAQTVDFHINSVIEGLFDGVFKIKNDLGTQVEVGEKFAGTKTYLNSGDAQYSDASVWVTGKNATFDNGGTLGGTLVVSTTAADLLDDGPRVFKYTQNATAANSQDDFIASAIVDIPDAVNFASQKMGYEFRYNYDGSDDDIEVRVKCTDDSTLIIDNTIDGHSLDNGYNIAKGEFVVPKDCNQIEVGVQVVTPTASAVLVYNRVKITDDPSVFRKLTDSQFLHFDGHAGYGSTNTAIPYFTNFRINKGVGLLAVINNSADGLQVTATRDNVRVTVHYSAKKTTAGGAHGLSMNSTQLSSTLNSITDANRIAMDLDDINRGGTVSASVILDTGEFINPHTDKGSIGSANLSSITITAEADASHVVKAPSGSAVDIYLKVNDVNGLASADTAVVHFKTVEEQVGNITYTSDSTNGSVITINETGIYDIGTSVDFANNAANIALAIAKNLTDAEKDGPYTDIVDGAKVLANTFVTNNNSTNPDIHVSFSGKLVKGDEIVILVDVGDTPSSNATRSHLVISKQAQAAYVIIPASAVSEDSIIVLREPNGNGSSNTRVRKFKDIVTNKGSAMTLTQSATLGDSVLINEAGLYHITYNDEFDSNSQLGISLNSTELSTSIETINKIHRLCNGESSGGSEAASCSTMADLVVGDIIRAHVSSTTSGQGKQAHFSIAKIGKPQGIVVGKFARARFETKIQAANQTTDAVDRADLTFSNLTIGNHYRISGVVQTETSSTQRAQYIFRSGATCTGTIYGLIGSDNLASQSMGRANISPNILFTAVSTSLYSCGEFSSGLIAGDGTKSKTFLTLEALDTHTETNEF